MKALTMSGEDLATTCDDYAARGMSLAIEQGMREVLNGEDFEDLSDARQRRYQYLATRRDALGARMRGKINYARTLEDNAERLVELIQEGDGVE